MSRKYEFFNCYIQSLYNDGIISFDRAIVLDVTVSNMSNSFLAVPGDDREYLREAISGF